jgi:hypothetical protein
MVVCLDWQIAVKVYLEDIALFGDCKLKSPKGLSIHKQGRQSGITDAVCVTPIRMDAESSKAAQHRRLGKVGPKRFLCDKAARLSFKFT